MKKKKQIGIQMDFAIFHNDDNVDITLEEMDEFLDELIEIVEKRNWGMGGGMKLIDEDGNDLKKI